MNRAARLEAHVRDEIGDEFKLTDLGEAMLKDKSEAVRVFAVDG